MRGPRKVILACLASAAIAGVASLVMTQLDQSLNRWFLRVEMPEVHLRLTRWVAAPLLAGLVAGAFATALFRTKRLLLPLAPAFLLLLVISASWLQVAFGHSLRSLVASQQWRALLLCLPFGGVMGAIAVRRLFPVGRG